MKLRQLITAFAAAVGITTAATAATPVAVWDGDFTTATKGDWTLSSTGSTITDASVTIGTTPITIAHSSDVNTGWYTVVYKVKGLLSTSTTPLATFGRNTSDAFDNANLLGALAENDTPWGIWNGAKRTNAPVTQQAMGLGTDATVEHKIVVRYRSGVANGVWAIVDGVKRFVADNGLKATISKVNRFTVLGYYNKANDVLTGAVVTGIAIFSDSSDSGDSAYVSYMFPSETSTYKSVLSLNFGASSYNVPAETDPGAIVDDSNWYNLNGNNITDAAAGTALVSYGGSGTYQNTGKVSTYLKGYIDDNGKTVNISITNLTGVAYDVYIYCSSDDATGWAYKTVNGANYYALASGEATLGTASWGSNGANYSVLGANVMVIRGVVPGDDGSITIASTRNDKKRGCVAAVQLGEIEQEIPKEFSLGLSEDAAWQSAGWSPAIPAEGMAPDAVATVTATGDPTLTLDGTITVGTLKIVSEADNMLTIKKNADANTSFGTLDVSEAVDGITLDAKGGFTACSALLNAARTGNYKFYFLGEGENGATLDYGTAAYDNNTIQGHYIFEGGVHTFQKVSESGGLLFGANATVENPTFWVKDGATLNFKSRNPCGWSAAASTAGIVRIGEGATVVAMNADASAGTWYWSQQFYLEDGATFEIGTTGDNFRTVGNSADAPHFKVPEGASAEIAGGDSNYFALPANDGGAAVFDVGEDATLTVSAKLKTLANGKPLVKYGAGTLKVTSDVSAFNGAVQVKAGTLESTLAMGNNATFAVDADATLKIVAAEDRAFSKSISGAGAVVKAGEGTLGVTPGQFGDNLVAIEGGALKFTITHEQAVAGVVLCKADDDISANVIVVNEAGEELSGDYTFEDNALSFKVNCVDVSFTLDEDTDWSEVADSLGWINSPESTLTVTCAMPEAVLRFDQEIIAKSIKFVSEDGTDAIIPDGSFQYMQIASYDFTEAEGGVAISFQDLETGELRLVTGVPIAGFANVGAVEDSVPEGYGFYADASNIWLCKTIEDVTRTSPTTEDVQAFTNFFVGVVSGDWADKANWRTAKDGLLAPYQYAKYPQSPEAQQGNWYPACFDGAIIDEYEGTKEITCATVEGWETKLCFCNGVEVTIDRLKKFANNFMWIDETSSVEIKTLGGSTFQYGYVFNVAGQLTIGTFEGNIAGIPYTYNLGDEAVVTYKDGVKTGTHAINGGKLVAEGNGIAAAVTVTNDVAITTPALAAVTISQDSTLTLTSTAEGDLAISSNWTNNGTLDVAEGTVVFKPGVTPGNYTENGGKVIIGQQVTINDCGKIAVTGETADDIRLFDVGGNPVEVDRVEGGYAYYNWDIEGENCWWAYEFEGDLTSIGTDKTSLTAEGTTPYYNEDGTALRVGYGTPYRGANYPENFTAVFYGKMVSNTNHLEIGFGSTTTGTKYGVVIACGDPAQNEVQLLVTSGYGILETVSMKVPNAYDADHLYAFACQTVNDAGTDKTKVSVYLDGKFLQAYTFSGKITLGGGFQIGSIHGGGLSGRTKATTANDHADLEFLRVYKTALTAEAMTKYAETYPYVSENGSSARTFAGNADWAAAEGEPWNVTLFDKTQYASNVARNGSVVMIDATEASEVTMNLTEATQYEALTVGEGADITLRAGDVKPTVTGLADVKADVTVDYDAIGFGTVAVAAGKSLTFDFTDFPFASYYASATIPYTGATSGDGTIAATGLPTEGVRTATFGKNASTSQYELKITVAPTPFVFTIAEGEETGVWTWNGEAVTEAIVNANPNVEIWKKGDGVWTNAVNRAIVVKEGKLVAASAGTATVTVDEGGVFDFNGKADGFVTVNLNGGSLVNNGGEMGTGNRQMNGIALTADSTVGGTGNFGLISGGYAANTLDLGGATLEKTGANTFFLTHTIVTNGTFDVKEGAVRIVNSVVTFTSDAELILASGTTLDVRDTLAIGAITSDGGTIDNAGTIGNFTLTGSATLTGNGTWGTNTLAKGAVANIGQKRGLVFAGAGTVNVELTEAEYGAGAATLFTPGEGSAAAVGTVMYDGEDITSKCTISGSQITFIDKGVALTGISIPATAAVAVAGSAQLELAVTPEDADIVSTVWASDDEGVCTVDGDGNVLGVAVGNATVTVTVTDVYGTVKVAQCAVTVADAPSYPSWMEGMGAENIEKYNTWAASHTVGEPESAECKKAFLFNTDNTEMALAVAEAAFKIHSITVDSEGKVTIEPPNPSDVGVYFFNGQVIVRGSATVDGEYTLEQDDPDARFFRAFLELIPAN